MDATELLQGYPVIPVVVIDDVSVSVRLAETLSDAGLNVIEVTLRTDDALAAIRAIAESVPGMIVGAGSIRRPQQFAEVKEAGAAFAVSPGASDALLDTADELGYGR
jgi:2-dehydro-3-deoxyphosphogluconate aldolase/(4S)-4-hydroxy-2-oxoglutarate aldolase